MPYGRTTAVMTVETPESVAFEQQLAGLASRGVAFALDSLMLLGVLIGEAALFGGLTAAIIGLGKDSLSWLWPWTIGVGLVVAFLTVWGWFVVGESSYNGRTPGKRLVGIRVVREDGGRLTVLDALIRSLLRIVDIMPAAFLVGVVSILATPKRQRLGDLAAGTVVVRDDPLALAELPQRADSARAALLSEYRARRDQLTPSARDQLEARMAAFADAALDEREPSDLP